MGKYRRLGRQTIDPRKVQVVIHSEQAVQGYMANPNWKGPDVFGNGGFPSVLRRDDGSYTAQVGNHRIAAAARKGRRIRAEVWVRKGGPQDKRRGWW